MKAAMRAQNWPVDVDQWAALVKKARFDAIEECAQAADKWQRSVSAKPVGEFIRALKDKPRDVSDAT